MKILLIIALFVSNCLSESVEEDNFSFSEEEISSNLENPVLAVFPSKLSKRFIYANGSGKINWYDLNSKTSSELIAIESNLSVALVTFALGPDYNTDSKIYVGFYEKKSESKDLVIQVYTNLSGDGYVMEREVLRLLDRSDTDKNFSIAFDFNNRLLVALHDGSKKFKGSENSLNLESLWGKVLRYEVQEEKLIAPIENPFVMQKIKNNEIYALGFREPSSIVLDKDDKRIYLTDVGEDSFHEFNRLESGRNYGWPIFEGSSCLKMQLECKNLNNIIPIYQYSFKTGKSIRASDVYNQNKYESLKGYALVHDSKKHFITAIKTGDEPSKKKIIINSGKAYQQVFFNDEGRIFALSQNSIIELVLSVATQESSQRPTQSSVKESIKELLPM